MSNLMGLMQQAQEMQKKLTDIQNELGQIEVDGFAGAGLVRVVISGKGDMRRIHIDPTLMKPLEKEILEDLIVAAFADAKAKSEWMVQERMKELAAGMGLPTNFNTMLPS